MTYNGPRGPQGAPGGTAKTRLKSFVVFLKFLGSARLSESGGTAVAKAKLESKQEGGAWMESCGCYIGRVLELSKLIQFVYMHNM